MAWYPSARKRSISANFTQFQSKKNCVILHSTASASATSQFGWFNDPDARASSHFHVATDGTVEQYIDTAHISWCNKDANGRSITIETQGSGDEPWSEQQMRAMAALIKWLCSSYAIPLQKMSDSDDIGVGWHRIGIDGDFPSGALAGREQRGGSEVWSDPGKACPGDKRILQVDRLLIMARGRDVTSTRVDNSNGDPTGVDDVSVSDGGNVTITDPTIDGHGDASIDTTQGGNYSHLTPSAVAPSDFTYLSTITTTS